MLSGYRTFLPLALVVALCAGAAWAALDGRTSKPSAEQLSIDEPDTQTFAQMQRTRDANAGRLEGRLAALKDRLKITPQQNDLWNAYADSLRKSAANRVRTDVAPSANKDTPSNLIDQLEVRRKAMEAATERMAETENATKSLYSGLSDEQKHIADRELAPRVMTGGLRRRATDGRYNSERPRLENGKSDNGAYSADPRSPV